MHTSPQSNGTVTFNSTCEVVSNFRTFKPGGDAALAKLLKEIPAIAALKKVETGNAVEDCGLEALLERPRGSLL